MENKIQFELVSPEAKLVSEPVHMAVIPGEEGEFGVLAGHSSLVASLKPGVVELLKEEGGEKRKIFIVGGFADVTGVQCTILAEEAFPVEELDAAALAQDIQNLNEDLGLVEGEADKLRVMRKLQVAEAKLAAAEAK